MSAATAISEAKKANIDVRNVIEVYGKISSFRKLKTKQTKETFFCTLITLPSGGDEFSQPQTVEVMSEDQLGQAGEVVTVKCSLGGYRRSFSSTDEDGVVTKTWTAENKLNAI